MDKAIDISSPNLSLDAEGDVDSSFGDTSLGAFDIKQAGDSASPTIELCFEGNSATSTALQTDEDVDEAIVPTPEPVVSVESRTEADQAIALTVAPAVSELSPPETAISASEQEHELRGNIQQTKEKLVQLPPIIVDDNGGQTIVIDCSDDDSGSNDENSVQSPLHRAQRKRSTPRSSKEYKRKSATSLIAAWENMLKQWRPVHAKCDRQLARTLFPFCKKIFKVRCYELWKEKYRKHDGRRLYCLWKKHGMERKALRQLTGERDSKLVRMLGKALRRLHEAEEEYRSISVAMDNGKANERG